MDMRFKIITVAILTISFLPCGCNTQKAAVNPIPLPLQAYESFKINNHIDELVLAKLKEKQVAPSEICSDEVFVRRAYLDVIGTIPQSWEAKAFLSDKTPDKRTKLIDKLLARSEFADYWSLKWSDLLRIKAEFPSNLWPNAVQAYHRWVRDSIRSNMSYDQFVRQLLTSNGSNFRVPPVNFYRAFQERTPRQIAENIALVFMGLRLDDSGFTEAQILGMSAFFAKIGYKNTDEWKEEIVFYNPYGKLENQAATCGIPNNAAFSELSTSRQPPMIYNSMYKTPVTPAFPVGKTPLIPKDKDPRIVFSDWLTAPDNPWFARNISNRIWFWIMGRGIVNEADDMRATNPPWSPELLSYLEKELVKNKFDLKHVYRLILTSNTYQLSSKANRWNAADEDGFSHYRIRRIDAEPLIDAICQITGSSEKYTSNIPEPFTFIPGDQRTILLADGSIDSPFLEMFGRPTRNTSYESERNSSPSVIQAQYMLNSSDIQRKIEQSGPIKQLLSAKKGNPYVIEELYLRILSRFPSELEKNESEGYMSSTKKNADEAVCDIAWALINTKEFILKH
jgi:hypothetical protein